MSTINQDKKTRRSRLKQEIEAQKAALKEQGLALKQKEEELDRVERENEEDEIAEEHARLIKDQTKLEEELSQSFMRSSASLRESEARYKEDCDNLKKKHEACVEEIKTSHTALHAKGEMELCLLRDKIKANEDRKRDLKRATMREGDVPSLEGGKGDNNTPAGPSGAKTALEIRPEAHQEHQARRPNMARNTSGRRYEVVARSENTIATSSFTSMAPLTRQMLDQQDDSVINVTSYTPKTTGSEPPGSQYFADSSLLNNTPSAAPKVVPDAQSDEEWNSSEAEERLLEKLPLIIRVGKVFYELGCPFPECRQNSGKGGFFKGVHGLNGHIGALHGANDYYMQDYRVHEYNDSDAARIREGKSPASRPPVEIKAPVSGKELDSIKSLEGYFGVSDGHWGVFAGSDVEHICCFPTLYVSPDDYLANEKQKYDETT